MTPAPALSLSREAKRRRCFHRVISGIERGGTLRFLTLTSGPESPPDIQRSWHALIARLKRRHLVSGYIRVPERTQAGRLHLHVLFRGSYIEQALISAWWSQIHKAPIVDIRAVILRGDHGQIASYMAKYMSKESAGHYSWDWGWVWRGFCHDWLRLKRYYRDNVDGDDIIDFHAILTLWRAWLHGQWKPPWLVPTLSLNHFMQAGMLPAWEIGN